MNTYAMIMAGGSGSSMNRPVPKQFLEVAGKPVIMHTFEIFRKYNPDIQFILVLPESEVSGWRDLEKKHSFSNSYTLAYGGDTRFQSVKNGLEKISSEGIVFIHDAVRPLVSQETLKRCFRKTFETGNAIPVIPVSESIRKVEGETNMAVDRSLYFLVQTPQTFRVSLIKKAYKNEYLLFFTDDAPVLESTGEIIYIVEGNRERGTKTAEALI